MGHDTGQGIVRNADLAEEIDAAHGGLGYDATGLAPGYAFWDGTIWRHVPGQSTVQSYLYDTTVHTAGDPGVGYLRLNNADPTLATTMWISQTNNIGQDIGDILNLVNGDKIIIDDPNTADTRVIYTAGAILDLGAYYSIVLTYNSGGGTEIAQDQPVSVKFDIAGGAGGGDEFIVLHADIRNASLPTSSDRWMGTSSYDTWKTTWLAAAQISPYDLSLEHIAIFQMSANAPSASATTHIFGFDIENGTTIHTLDAAMGWTWGGGTYQNVYSKDLSASGFTINAGDRYAFKIPSTAWTGPAPTGARMTIELYCKKTS